MGTEWLKYLTDLIAGFVPIFLSVEQDTMALDMLLASEGGVCMVINASYCMDQSGRISTELDEIWKHTKILHEILKDVSWGFKETWKLLTSWFPDLSQWVTKLLAIIIMALLIFACICVVL